VAASCLGQNEGSGECDNRRDTDQQRTVMKLGAFSVQCQKHNHTKATVLNREFRERKQFNEDIYTIPAIGM
jgi:hypothetical protein